MIGGVSLSTLDAQAALVYTPIPQSGMSIAKVSSAMPADPATNVLDGKVETIWHSQWSPAEAPPPHNLDIRIADVPVALGRVHLTPRESSNGSGRIRDYKLLTATGDCATATYTERASGTFPGDRGSRTEARTITLPEPADATCVRVSYLNSWGGGTDDPSPATTAASLAEFNADTAADDGVVIEPADPKAIEVVVPAGAVELADGDLKVRMHPGFPQVVDYRLGDKQMPGRVGDALTSVLINEVEQSVTVAAPTEAADGKSATYKLTFPGLPGVSMNAVASVADGTFRLTFTDIVDPGKDVNRLRIPNHDLVTVGSADAASQLTAGMMNLNRGTNGDRYENVAATNVGSVQGSWMVFANNSTLAAAFDSNSTDDNTAGGAAAGRVQTSNNRWQRQVVLAPDAVTKYGTVWAGTWTWLGQAAEQYDAPGSIGRDEDPYLEVKITADANADNVVDWQDAGIVARDIITFANGMDTVKNEVISRIPFNIVSQATHPFLRTLDDTKRISLATDNLGQKALLKGYQDQGHDSAHPDYADHYNEMAGGLTDLETLADAGTDWNTSYGVHVNATETYSEAKAFSEDLLRMPPQPAWGWMNQAYYIDGPKDLAKRNVLDRFQAFWDERPANLDWLYIDVYWPSGWEGERLGKELNDMGWTIGSEWSDKFPEQNIWSHWSQEENYGGTTNKGINSDVVRFVYNSKKDTWNPHPVLSNSNLVDFEGWTGHNNYNGFINNVWQRNLPVKFLQQSDIVKWDKTGGETITFANGTVATSELTTISGSVVPTDRTFTYDGADVYTDGAYLLPWSDGGEDRLYHYNTGGGSTTWTLTDSWKTQGKLSLFKLTDTGNVKVSDVTPVDGKITLDAEDGVAYVLYPTSDVPAAKAPNWGQGSHIADPGFFSGTLDAYDKTGNATIEKSNRGNFQAVLGSGESSISQKLALPAGTYSSWAWVQIEPGKQRLVSVEASGTGVTPAGYAEGTTGKVVNNFSASSVVNATASDEKVGLNFQRTRVTFTSTGQPVTLTVAAGGGNAKVIVDDLRVVDWKAPVDADESEDTVYFQDFENVDTGYFPFVTGATNRGGDARTQLAEKHAPYSQKGWWGIELGGAVTENGKRNDNVLDGEWSLMANNENTGEILKTSPGAIPFKAGHKYQVSFDYQTTYANQYQVRIGKDVANGGGFTTTNLVTDRLGEKLVTTQWNQEFTADSCDTFFLAVDKLQGANSQHNMTMDNLRVVDLGQAADVTCVNGSVSLEGGSTVNGGEVRTVTTTITSLDEASITGVSHDLVVPAGWEAELITPGASTLTKGKASVATWALRVPRDASSATITLDGTAVVGGASMNVGASAAVMVIGANETYLSDMQEDVTGAPVNGYGAIEWDTSNGENLAGDGGPLKLGGVTYPKGIGTHAVSRVDFDLTGQECTTFQAIVGVDDSRGSNGSVTFAVYGDDVLIGEQTAVLRGGGTPVALDRDITGVKTLSLRVGNGDGAISSDHGDWALARVACGESAAPVVDPKATATPTTVEPGDTVTLALSGFAPTADSSIVEVYVGGKLYGSTTIDADGNGSATVKVAANTADGALQMELRQWGAGITGVTASVTVKKKVVQPTPTPTRTPTPTPTVKPSGTPTVKPSSTPTQKPTVKPTQKPTVKPTQKPTVKPFEPQDVYTTPGYHTVNGRQWFTKCEPYSTTFRCWTSIWSTQVTYKGGNKFVSNTGWAFNNLTYLPAERSLWAGNPLGHTTNWTAADGRKWYTECDTATTGGNGCRSYIWATNAVEARRGASGVYTYVLVNKWVFNNIVLFK